jgi:hypothetical protein
MSADEMSILEALDAMLGPTSVRAKIDAIVTQIEQELAGTPSEVMAWQPIPMTIYGNAISAGIQSSWVFILRAGATTGAERHPNSHQRVMSYRGRGDLQVKVEDEWHSHELASDSKLPLSMRWASIPVNVWHQAVVPDENWIVVSFHTALANELLEERPDGSGSCQRLYLEHRNER